MAKAHPARSARIAAGYLSAAGFATGLFFITEDAAVQVDLRPLVAGELSNPGEGAGEFSLDGGAEPAQPSTRTTQITGSANQSPPASAGQPERRKEPEPEADSDSDAS